MKKLNLFTALNGYFTLTKLKPSFMQFAKSDISSLKVVSNEDSEAVWQNTQLKAIGRIASIGSDTANKRESIFAKKFMRNFL